MEKIFALERDEEENNFFVKIKSHLQRNHSHLQFIAYIQITQIIPTTMALKKNINTKSTNKSSSSTSKIKRKQPTLHHQN